MRRYLLAGAAALSASVTLQGSLALRGATATLDSLERGTVAPMAHLKSLSDAYAVSIVDAPTSSATAPSPGPRPPRRWVTPKS